MVLRSIYVFLDTFQGQYKDGTNGTRDYTRINFVLRIGVVYVLDKPLRGRPISHYVPLASILIITSLFYSVFQPCKKKYMNNIESVLYCATGLLLLYFGTVRAHLEGDYKKMSIFLFNFLMMIIALPSILLLAYLMIYKTTNMNCLRKFFFHHRNFSPDLQLSPDRLVNPLNYKQLA